MQSHSVDIMCIQETRKLYTDTYISDCGQSVFLSGAGHGLREWAGVGFIVAARLCQSVRGFKPISNRIAQLQLSVRGGFVTLLTVLSPHNLRPLPERIEFHNSLERTLESSRRSRTTYILGDFNARMGQRRPGEEHILGDYCFGREAQHAVELPNRDLVIELCTNFEYIIANTWAPNPDHGLVTYHEPTASPMSPISVEKFNVLDFVLCPAVDAHKVLKVNSDRFGCIASHHFPVIALLDVGFEHSTEAKKKEKLQWETLQDTSVHAAFVDCFAQCAGDADGPTAEGINDTWHALRNAFNVAADTCIPKAKATRQKPWISDRTLTLIQRRRQARFMEDWDLEKQLRKDTKRSARQDRATWLTELAGKGDWHSLKQLRGQQRNKQTRLVDRSGNIVSTDRRAETLAEYLEQVQWQVRPVTVLPDLPGPLFPMLAIQEDPFTHTELRRSIFQLSSGKAVRTGDPPIECFKTLALSAGPALQPLLDLYNTCWTLRTVPTDWITARVAMIFKKGDPAQPSNYRPICLTAVAYRIYAGLIKQRLLDAGIDQRLWPSQFGFRKGRSTIDALYVARRHIELACAKRGGQISLLALDWARAFDSVHVGRLLHCLRRFGVTGRTHSAISSLMHNRQFYVEDFGVPSERRLQRSGISQGCTLSPLLFVIVMSAVMQDAVDMLTPAAKAAREHGLLADIVYADDTLLLGVSPAHLEEFLRCISFAGRAHGLELHEGKFQLLQVRCAETIRNTSGQPIAGQNNMGYLGASLASDGTAGAELSRRIGMAKHDFRALCKVWRHSTLTTKRKLEVYKSLVESKLLYGLVTASFTKAQLRRLDGFQAKCLRTIMGVQPSFLSRISNETVRAQADWKPASKMLRLEQLVYLGKVLRSDPAGPLKQVSFVPDTLLPATDRCVRRVGRPRKEWLKSVMPDADHVAGGHSKLKAAVASPNGWKQLVVRKSEHSS